MCLRYRNPQNIYDVLQPLLACSKVFGQTAFLIVGVPPYVQVKVSRAEYVALLMNLLVNCFCVYINITNQRLSRLTGSVVMDMGLSFLFPLGAIFMILLALDNFLRRNLTCTIIAELFKVDRSLQRKSYKLNHRRQYVVLMRILIMLIGLIASGTVFSLVMTFFSEFSIRNHAINAFSYVVTGVQFMIVNFHFVSAARLITYRLEAIKGCLKKHLDAGSWWIEQRHRWGRRVEPIDVIADLAEDFATLAHVIERANRIYSNQIVALISGVAMFSIFVIYASSYSYYVGSMQESRLTLILLSAWVFYIIMVGLIFFSGMGVKNMGIAIADLLHEALHREDDLPTRRKLICFSQQVLLRPPKLRCMFYEYNWKTLFSLFGIVVTYLVILLQFDKISSDSSYDRNVPAS
ncbi:uncharacterized protein LOC126559944 [Anopheles maculipalpis]|uniref:uncharacterized protein LOC126559944 n=1 Tax=Anopheles maculipalpis TaxID=1496333 RepID=UPI0021590DC5|nr:uncharacterized protein LOC126559944 [Anopheles maculipalpis]